VLKCLEFVGHCQRTCHDRQQANRETASRNVVAKASRGNFTILESGVCHSTRIIQEAVIAWEIMASAQEKHPEAQV
jgi:hypothetical protein